MTAALGEVSIRRCTESDVELVEAREPPRRRYASATFKRQELGLCTFLIAWVKGEPVGSGELESGSPPELKNLHVERAHRRRGVGTALIQTAEAEAARSEGIRIGVGTDNPEALRLYQALGYRPVGALVTYTYAFVDDNGLDSEATEEVQYLEKTLQAHEPGPDPLS